MRKPRDSLWQHQDFRRLWIGQTISAFGSNITREGLPLTAILVLSVTPAQMGVLAAVGAAPVLLVGLLAGAWVDRLRRRPILIAADIGRALLLGSIPLAALAGMLSLEQLYVVAALVGVLSVFFDVAYHSFLPAVVQREHVVEGNSKLGVSSSVAEIAGPSVGGLLVQVIGGPLAILIDAVSFLVSALFIGRIRAPEPSPANPTRRPSVLREIVEGLRVVLSNPLLRAIAASSSMRSFFGSFFGAIYGLYAIRELGMSPAILGVVVGSGGIGSLGGAALASWAARRLGLGAAIIRASLLSGAAALLIPIAGGPLIVAIAMMIAAQIVGDLAMTIASINELSLRQTITPDRLLGRTNASMHVVVTGVGALGLLAGGGLAEIIGLRSTTAVASLGILLSCLWLIFSPIRTLREQPAPADESPLAVP